MHIHPFGVEQWMNAWETRCELNLAETCVESLTLAQLLDLCGSSVAQLGEDLAALQLTYGHVEGSPRLRSAIAALYVDRGPEHVLVTHGTIGANHLVHTTLVEPGDHVVAIRPTYEQHYAIPASIGARVSPLWLRESERWQPDLDRLRDLVRGTPTRLVALTNPNNPTGALLDAATLTQIADIAQDAGARVLCDEVYRGTELGEAALVEAALVEAGPVEAGPGEAAGAPDETPSIADLMPQGISTAGMSKAFSLAGLRLGWIVADPDVLRRVEVHRDYTTISVGRIDDHLAALALEHAPAILARSRALLAANLAVVADWVAGEPRIAWVPPAAGTTALLRYDLPMTSHDLCRDLIERTGVLLTPGSAFDLEGYVRIGIGNNPQALAAGLARLSDYLAGAGGRVG